MKNDCKMLLFVLGLLYDFLKLVVFVKVFKIGGVVLLGVGLKFSK